MPVSTRSMSASPSGHVTAGGHRSSKTSQTELHVVTGGGGFPGYSLGKKLAEEGHDVRLLDIRPPKWDLKNNMSFIQVCKFH